MTIEYVLTKKDIVRFQMYHLYHNEKTTPVMCLLSIVIPIMLLSIPIRIFPQLITSFLLLPGWMKMVIAALIIAGGFFVIWVLMLVLSGFGVEREKKKNPNHPLGDRRIEFDEDGMRVKFRSYESSFAWRYLHKIVKRKEYYYIYTNSAVAQIIPKRIFTATQEEIFIELVKGKINKQKLSAKI